MSIQLEKMLDELPPSTVIMKQLNKDGKTAWFVFGPYFSREAYSLEGALAVFLMEQGRMDAITTRQEQGLPTKQ